MTIGLVPLTHLSAPNVVTAVLRRTGVDLDGLGGDLSSVAGLVGRAELDRPDAVGAAVRISVDREGHETRILAEGSPGGRDLGAAVRKQERHRPVRHLILDAGGGEMRVVVGRAQADSELGVVPRRVARDAEDGGLVVEPCPSEVPGFAVARVVDGAVPHVHRTDRSRVLDGDGGTLGAASADQRRGGAGVAEDVLGVGHTRADARAAGVAGDEGHRDVLVGPGVIRRSRERGADGVGREDRARGHVVDGRRCCRGSRRR